MCVEQGCAGLRDGANSELDHEKEYEAEMNEQQIQEKETEQGAEPRAIRIRNAHVHNLKNIDLEILLWLSDKNNCVCVRVKGEHSGPEGAAWLGKAEKSIGRRGIL